MAVLTHAEVKACIHPRQRARFLLALLCAIILLPLTALIAAFGVISLLLFWFLLLVWVAGRIFFARFVGNSILVSDLNYPRIQHLTEELKASLGVNKKVDVFIYEHGSFNAYMVKLFFRRAIFLNSEILETGVSDDEVRWIVGRFVGYWRAQKNAGIAGWLIRGAQHFIILNFFILPYDRAMVYTGDRLALATIGGDLSTGISAMQKLLVGRQLGYSVNPIGVVEQSRRVKGSFFAFLARLTSGFPHTVTRYVDMIVFAKRVYPEQFRLFNAANPGLPPDVERLSAEVGSPGAMFRAIAVLIGIVLAISAFGVVLTGVMQRTGMFGLGNIFDRPDIDQPPPSETDPDSAMPPDGAGATDQGQPAAEPPAAGDQAAPPDKADTQDEPAPEPPPAKPPRKHR